MENAMAPTRQSGFDNDRDLVDASAEHECEFWLRRFGVTYAELRAAISTVGARVTDLKHYFDTRS